MSEDDLTPHMQRKLEQAYEARERRQMSRQDFASGYVAALIDLWSKSSFKEGTWPKDERLPWE